MHKSLLLEMKWKKFVHHVNDTHIELTLTLTVSCKENALNSYIHPLSVILEQVEGYETTEWSPVKTLDPCNLFHQVISFLKCFQHKFKVFSSFSFSSSNILRELAQANLYPVKIQPRKKWKALLRSPQQLGQFNLKIDTNCDNLIDSYEKTIVKFTENREPETHPF